MWDGDDPNELVFRPGPPNAQTVDGEKVMLEVKAITVMEA